MKLFYQEPELKLIDFGADDVRTDILSASLDNGVNDITWDFTGFSN